jgi:hypothetical protein
MSTWNKRLFNLAILLLVSGVGFVDAAQADLRVDATLRGPGVQIRIGDGPHGVRGSIRVRHGERIRAPRPIDVVDGRDRRIADRLSDYTGVSKRELLRLRRDGYRWSEIGRRLELPRHVVQAAADRDSWREFLRHERRGSRRGHVDGRGWRIDGCYDR